MDAVAGEPVAPEFLRRNAPRHIGLLLGAAQQAQAEGRCARCRRCTASPR
jgi:hypothetical protein